MTNLTQTAFFSKKIALAAGITLVALIAFLFLTSIGKSLIAIFAPPKPYPATVAFGKLPPLDFSSGFRPPDKVVYTLETTTGNLPKLETLANVFEIATPVNSFGDSAKSKTRAQKMGFGDTPIDFVGTNAKFADNKTINRVLNMDTAGGNFEIASNYLTNLQVINAKAKSLDEAKKTAQDLQLAAELGNINFDDSQTTTVLYKIDGSKLTEVNSLAQANLVAVKYGRAEIEKKKVVYDSLNNPEFWVLVSGNDIVAAHNSTVDIELNKFATYPLRGVTKAFDELKKGNAVYNRGPVEKIGNVEISTSPATALKPFAEGKFPIFSIELGYFLSSKYEGYLEPVYIFNSDNGLAAYVSAVDDAWIDHLGQ